MRINNPWNSVLAAVRKIERELLPFLVGKISVEKRADPRPAAFGNGNDNGVGAGKLAGAAAEIPSHHATNLFAYVWRSSGAAPDKSPRDFIGGMMSESASPLQQGLTIIEIRPPGTVGSVLRPQGVQPYWTGANAKEDAFGYAKARAKFGRAEIRVLNANGSIKDVIRLDKSIRNYD